MPLKLVRRKGSPCWYIRGSVRGQAVFESSGTDDRSAADAIRIKREAALLERSVFGAGATVTFAEAAASYVEAGGEARFLGGYDEETGKMTLLMGRFYRRALASIGQNDIDEAARDLYPGAGPATRKRMVYVPMCAVLNHAARKQWVSRPMIVHPKVPKPATRWATPDQVRKVLAHCAPRLRRFVMLLVYTGARLSEVLALDWERDVMLAERTIVFRDTKNLPVRSAHIPDPLLIELADVAERERKGRLCPWAHKSHVRRPLMTAFAKAGVPYLSPHQLGRHTFATWLRVYAKRDLKGLMEDGGWKDLKSVERYAHTVSNETEAAVGSLPSVQNPSNSKLTTIKDRRMRKKIA